LPHRPLNIREGELWIAVTGPPRSIPQKRKSVFIVCKPRLIKAMNIVVRDVTKAIRQLLIEAFGEQALLPGRFNEVEQRIAEDGFIGSGRPLSCDKL
jgi:hypothetical protein